MPNGVGISILGSSHNTVGGNASSSGNLISGNTGDGILINSSNGAAAANSIEGNLIGVTAGGLAHLPMVARVSRSTARRPPRSVLRLADSAM